VIGPGKNSSRFLRDDSLDIPKGASLEVEIFSIQDSFFCFKWKKILVNGIFVQCNFRAARAAPNLRIRLLRAPMPVATAAIPLALRS
jgi:hypothetical protein